MYMKKALIASLTKIKNEYIKMLEPSYGLDVETADIIANRYEQITQQIKKLEEELPDEQK